MGLTLQAGEDAACRTIKRATWLTQSICASEALMIGAHLASSLAMKSALDASVLPGVGVMPATSSALITLGSASASLIALLRRSAIGFGTPAGEWITFHV